MDSELLTLFQQGNRQAFAVIYDRYARDLYRFARKNITSREDCEEIVQEVFESLLARTETLQVASLRHYLFSAVRYKVIRYFQHRDVKRKYAAHYRLFAAQYEGREETPAVDPQLLHASLLDHIHDLPDRCREAIRLRITENLSNGEIADRMHINKRTAELYISQAFAHLRASYDKIYKTAE